MKNKILTKIALASAMLAGATGCDQYEHKNVVMDVKHVDCETIVLLQDVETNQERYYMTPKKLYNVYKYAIGDTVNVIVRGFLKDNYYSDGGILRSRGGDCAIHMNADSILARQRREEYSLVKQRFANQK